MARDKKIGSPKNKIGARARGWGIGYCCRQVIRKIYDVRSPLSFFVSIVVLIFLILILPIVSNRHSLPGSSFEMSVEQSILHRLSEFPEAFDRSLSVNATREEIRAKIDKEIADLQGSYAYYFYDLETGEFFGSHEDDSLTAASIVKLFVVGAYYDGLSGDLVQRETVTIRDEDKIDDSPLSTTLAGTSYSPMYLVERMLNMSDNVAFSMMTRFVGFRNVSDFVKKIGLNDTSFATNDTTARDVGKFLTSWYRQEFLDNNQYEQMRSFMSNTISEDRIPYYLPEEVYTAHKIGTWSGVYNDAGIVYTPFGDYVIIIMSEQSSYPEAIPAIRNISRMLYDYFVGVHS